MWILPSMDLSELYSIEVIWPIRRIQLSKGRIKNIIKICYITGITGLKLLSLQNSIAPIGIFLHVNGSKKSVEKKSLTPVTIICLNNLYIIYIMYIYYTQCVSNMVTPILTRNSLKVDSVPSLRGRFVGVKRTEGRFYAMRRRFVGVST